MIRQKQNKMIMTALCAFSVMSGAVSTFFLSHYSAADGGSTGGGGGTDVSDTFTSWCANPLETLFEAVENASSPRANSNYLGALKILSQGLNDALKEAGESATENSLTANAIAQGIGLSKAIAKVGGLTSKMEVEQVMLPYYREIVKTEETIDLHYFRKCRWDIEKCPLTGEFAGAGRAAFVKQYEIAFLRYVIRRLEWVNEAFIVESGSVPNGSEYKRYTTSGPGELYLRLMAYSLNGVLNDLPASPFYRLYDCQMRKIKSLYDHLDHYLAGARIVWEDEPHAIYDVTKRSKKIIEKLYESIRHGSPRCH